MPTGACIYDLLASGPLIRSDDGSLDPFSLAPSLSLFLSTSAEENDVLRQVQFVDPIWVLHVGLPHPDNFLLVRVQAYVEHGVVVHAELLALEVPNGLRFGLRRISLATFPWDDFRGRQRLHRQA